MANDAWFANMLGNGIITREVSGIINKADDIIIIDKFYYSIIVDQAFGHLPATLDHEAVSSKRTLSRALCICCRCVDDFNEPQASHTIGCENIADHVRPPFDWQLLTVARGKAGVINACDPRPNLYVRHSNVPYMQACGNSGGGGRGGGTSPQVKLETSSMKHWTPTASMKSIVPLSSMRR